MAVRPTLVVLALVTAAGVSYGQGTRTFLSHPAFVAFNEGEGKELKGTEDFEEGVFAPTLQVGVLLRDPLNQSPNTDDFGNGFPQGLTQRNLYITSSRAAMGLPSRLFFEGFPLINSNKVGAEFDVDETWIVFPQYEHTGVGLTLDSFGLPAANQWRVNAYDPNFALLASELVDAVPGQAKTFWGIWAAPGIRLITVDALPRIDGGGGFEMVDDIEMWIPSPGAGAVLALAGIAAVRRRR